MKDLRKEIKERLREIEERRLALQIQLDLLVTKEASLKTLLQDEDERWNDQLTLDGMENINTSAGGRTPLARFILSNLKCGEKTTEQLSIELQKANIPLKSKFPKRALHFALVGMSNAGLVEKANGAWRLIKNEEQKN